MKKIILSLVATVLCATFLFARGGKDSLAIAIAAQEKFADSVEKAMKYETGSIALSNGIAKLNVPAGFKLICGVTHRKMVFWV
jgi:hypothetical protein